MGGPLHRMMIQRSESTLGAIGQKVYVPQVGDSIIYIAKAHYDTLRNFTTGQSSQPWKSWPTNKAWPVVRCIVTNVRYRFPYVHHYGSRASRSNKISSIVQLLTLEVTGVPFDVNETTFPWPKPEFKPRKTTSIRHTFEVGIF